MTCNLQMSHVYLLLYSWIFFFCGTENICSQYLANQVLLQLSVWIVYCCNVEKDYYAI